MLFQRFVYETLRIQRGVCIAYKIDIGTFYSLLANEGKVVLIIGIYYKLEKEVRYIDDREVFLSSNRIDDLLLQRQRVAVWDYYSIEWPQIYNDASFFDVFYYMLDDEDGECKGGGSVDVFYLVLLVENVVFLVEYSSLLLS
jgi:hypothetical protein